MFYVYLLRSQIRPEQTYIGFSEDLRKRLADHNAGRSPHTAKFRPWKVECYLAFEDEAVARAFEAYLKTSSGAAFATKRLGFKAPGGAARAPAPRTPNRLTASRRAPLESSGHHAPGRLAYRQTHG